MRTKIFIIGLALLLQSFPVFAASLTIPAGSTFDLGTATLYVTGEVNNYGTLEVSSGIIRLTGDWSNYGDFFSGTGTVEFIATTGSTQNINGSSSFYNFTAATNGVNFTFEASATQEITGLLYISGETASLITLRSSSEGTQWHINPTGTRAVYFVDVRDSRNLYTTLILPVNSTDSGNNIGWFPSGTVTLYISREANDILISWAVSPEGSAVDVYRLATSEVADSIYTNEATSAWVMIITGETFSSTKETNQIGSGFAQAYYKVIPAGQTDLFGTAEAVGKFNKSIPVGLSLFSVPILPQDTDIDIIIGDQLSNNDVIYYFTGTAWQDSTSNGTSWTGGVTDIYPDLGYWVRVQSTPGTVTVWGNVSSASREVSLSSGLNLKGTAYPIRVTLEDSDLGAALSAGSGDNTGTLYYFTGSAWQDSSWNGSWYNKGISYFYPTRGYWIRRNNTGGSTWYYKKLY